MLPSFLESTKEAQITSKSFCKFWTSQENAKSKKWEEKQS